MTTVGHIAGGTRLFILGLMVLTACTTWGADWSKWRGPNQDGMTSEKGWNPSRLSNVAWEKMLGVGYSAVCVKGSRLYTMGWVDDHNIVYCLDPATGQEIWSTSYKSSKGGGYSGPRATPVLDGTDLYVHGQDGHVHKLDAKTGGILWEANLTEMGAKKPKWNFAGSPVVTDRLVILTGGEAGMALDKRTGKKVWGQGGIGNYATPVLFQADGKPYAAIFGEEELHIVGTRDGRIVGSYDWKTRHSINAADPIVFDDKVFISSGYDHGCCLLKMKRGALSRIWENSDMRSQFSSPVMMGDYLYGVDGNAGRGAFTCIDRNTGAVKWRKKDLGFGSFIVADGKVIYLTEKGRLVVGTATPSSFEEIASAQVLDDAGKRWVMPVLSNGRIFCRGSNGKLLCLDVR